MAPRANWKGYLKLSLVSCAIALDPATTDTTRVRFNTISWKTGNRVKRQFIDPETEDVVDTENQVKGYAVSNDNFVTVEDKELDAIKIESTRTIDIDSFVPQKEIDHGYFDAPYYVAPEDKVSQEAFEVIRDAMQDKEVVGIGHVACQKLSDKLGKASRAPRKNFTDRTVASNYLNCPLLVAFLNPQLLQSIFKRVAKRPMTEILDQSGNLGMAISERSLEKAMPKRLSMSLESRRAVWNVEYADAMSKAAMGRARKDKFRKSELLNSSETLKFDRI
jgi:hypothetical protein